jgi:hypothetical protein
MSNIEKKEETVVLSDGVTLMDIPVSDFERSQKSYKCGFVKLMPYNQVRKTHTFPLPPALKKL